MRVSDHLYCGAFPCRDVLVAGHRIPTIAIDPERVRVVLISECAPADPADDYYAPGDPLFARTTVQAFQDGGPSRPGQLTRFAAATFTFAGRAPFPATSRPGRAFSSRRASAG